MKESNKIIVIGAANMDIVGFPDDKLIYNDDVIGTLQTTIGGVGRNIAVNLALLGSEVVFLSAFADDAFGHQIRASLKKQAISTKHSIILPNAKTSTFMAIMDAHNDMALGIAAMQIYDTIPDTLILDNLELLQNAKYCVLETNMPESLLQLAIEKSPNTKFFLDAVSGTKALKAKTILENLFVLKCNLIEAELLSGIQFKAENYKDIVQHFLSVGVKKVFITLGGEGVVYGNLSKINWLKPKVIKPVNTSGGGDAFMAGLVFAEIHHYDIDTMAKIATACAELTIQQKDTVYSKINKQLILNTIHV